MQGFLGAKSYTLLWPTSSGSSGSTAPLQEYLCRTLYQRLGFMSVINTMDSSSHWSDCAAAVSDHISNPSAELDQLSGVRCGELSRSAVVGTSVGRAGGGDRKGRHKILTMVYCYQTSDKQTQSPRRSIVVRCSSSGFITHHTDEGSRRLFVVTQRVCIKNGANFVIFDTLLQEHHIFTSPSRLSPRGVL